MTAIPPIPPACYTDAVPDGHYGQYTALTDTAVLCMWEVPNSFWMVAIEYEKERKPAIQIRIYHPKHGKHDVAYDEADNLILGTYMLSAEKDLELITTMRRANYILSTLI